MEHHFETGIAKELGIESAILLHNIYFWIDKNAKNGTNIYDGNCWTYNTNKAFAEMFPYINEAKIFRTLKHLQEQGYLLKGNYNKNKFDRTCWYAFSQMGMQLMANNGYDMTAISILQGRDMQIAQVQNGDSQSAMTIPYTETNKETAYTKTNSRSHTFVKPTIEEIRAYCEGRHNDVDAERFWNFYESKGWMVGKNHMKDWKASVRNWENTNKKESSAKERSFSTSGSNDMDYSQFYK